MRAQGYRILARNARLRGGEIDIVAVLDGVVVLVEVKTRTAPAGACLLEAIDGNQLRRIQDTGRRWLAARGGRRLPFRVAVVTVRRAPRAEDRAWWWRALSALSGPEVQIHDPLEWSGS